MAITDLKLYRYNLWLTVPLRIAGRRLDQRTGLLLQVTTDDARQAWGECAPLAGVSEESLETVEHELRSLRNRFLETRDMAEAMAALNSVSAATRFGLESAAAGIEGGRTHAAGRVLVNGLLAGDDEGHLETHAAAMAVAGYTCLKLKVGGRDIRQDVARVQRVRASIGPDVDLRLDANGSWSLEQAVSFAERVAATNIEYIEEPLRDPRDLPALGEKSPPPIALDESLRRVPESRWAEWPFVAAVVIKPGIVGGLSRAKEFVHAARASGKKAVLSGAFESGVGMRAIARLAIEQGLLDTAHGLDTYRFLAVDVTRPALDMATGRLEMPPVSRPEYDMVYERLDELI